MHHPDKLASPRPYLCTVPGVTRPLHYCRSNINTKGLRPGPRNPCSPAPIGTLTARHSIPTRRCLSPHERLYGHRTDSEFIRLGSMQTRSRPTDSRFDPGIRVARYFPSPSAEHVQMQRRSPGIRSTNSPRR